MSNRSIWVRRVGPIYRALLLDGSTVLAARHAWSHGKALKKAIDANLARGGVAFRLAQSAEDLKEQKQ